MKKLSRPHVALLGVVMLCSAFVLAGCNENPAETDTFADGALLFTESAPDPIMDGLDLTDEQKEQIRILVEAHREALNTRREELKDLPAEERRAAMRASGDELREAIHALLTDAQIAKLEALKEANGGRPPFRRGGFQGDPAERLEKHIEHLTERLSLTEEQQTSVREILESALADIQGLDTEGLSREEIHEARHSRMHDAHDEIRLILDEDQQAEFEQLMEEIKNRPRRRGGHH